METYNIIEIILILFLLFMVLRGVGYICIFSSSKSKGTNTAGYTMEKIVNIVKMVTCILFSIALSVSFVYIISELSKDSFEAQALNFGLERSGMKSDVYMVFIFSIVYFVLLAIMYAKTTSNYSVIASYAKGITTQKQISSYAIVMKIVGIVLVNAFVFVLLPLKVNKIVNYVDMMSFGTMANELGSMEKDMYISIIIMGVASLILVTLPSLCDIIIMNGAKKKTQ